jgi:hypothetical protein
MKCCYKLFKKRTFLNRTDGNRFDKKKKNTFAWHTKKSQTYTLPSDVFVGRNSLFQGWLYILQKYMLWIFFGKKISSLLYVPELTTSPLWPESSVFNFQFCIQVTLARLKIQNNKILFRGPRRQCLEHWGFCLAWKIQILQLEFWSPK